MSTRRGFTLIELLVVIAIIAILAAILFPVFAKAREKARQSACISNINQISIGVLMYTQDYDETMPTNVIFDPAGWTVGTTFWMCVVSPYVKSVKLFTCPSVPVGWDGKTSYTYPGDAATRGFCGYAYYRMLGISDPPFHCITLAEIESTPSCVMVSDAAGTGSTGSQCFIGWGEDATSSYPFPPNPVHSDGANLGFCDGHTKWINKTKLVPFKGRYTGAPDPSLWKISSTYPTP